MKAAQIQHYGGPEVVEVKTAAEKPPVEAGKVLVEVHASGVNPVDWKIRQGYLAQMAPLTFPATLGGDFSGVVADAGSGVTGFAKDDEVYGQASVLSGGSGSFAEYATADQNTIAHKPKKSTHLEAAALPLAGVSALQALVEHMGLSKGQKILIHGGAGGIGTFAIEIAKHLGAHVATTVSASSMGYVQSLGADETIDYHQQSFEELLRGYDAVFDTVGGETYKKSFKVLKKGAVIVSMLEQPDKELMERYGVKAVGQFTKITRARLTRLAELADQGVITVHLDKRFPLTETARALEYLETGHPQGKVVVAVAE